MLAEAIEAPVAFSVVTVAVVRSATPTFIDATEAPVAVRLVITAVPALVEAIDAPVAVKLVTVAVVSSATPAFMLAIDALVAVKLVTAALTIAADPMDALDDTKLVTVPVVINATAALADAIDAVGMLTLPVTLVIVMAGLPSSALMLVTSRLVNSSVVAENVPITATPKLADAADKLVAIRLENVPAAGDDPPMVVASMVPPLMSAVVATTLLSVTTPVASAMEPAAVPSLALRLVTSRLVLSTVVALTVVMLPVVAVAVVNVPAAAVPPPMVVPSMVPPLMSAVVIVPMSAHVPMTDTLFVSVQPLDLKLIVSAAASPTARLPLSVDVPATVSVPDTLRLVKLLTGLISWNRVPSYTTATISPDTMSPATSAVVPSRVTFFAPSVSMLSVTAPVLEAGAIK